MRRTDVEGIRRGIRDRDRQLVRLLNERARLSVEMGRMKAEAGLAVFDPVQERRVLDGIASLNEGPLPAEALRSIWREILSASRTLQAPLSVACLGPEGSFAHLAALERFGRSTLLAPQVTIGAVFDAVEKRRGDLGVVPLENSVEGPVRTTLERLIATPLAIRGEICLRVSHCLLAKGAGRRIRRVYSHPQALAQCRQWLARHLPEAAPVETESTSAAVLQALGDRQGAAIASRLASEIYGLPAVETGIEDHPENTTRFIVIGTGTNIPTGRDKTSVLFSTQHRPGALHAALAPFASAGINLLRIESHPVRDRMWQYLFFVDLEGHAEDRAVKDSLRSLRRKTAFLKVLGSYPREVEPS
ncbi:MAG TPA: prephenate dehydratase [Syntrophales bacterium]|nr:prephenate dehydratase [Syntrophobacterales bacterium]HQL90164.1 prephenate dehydratase [Syntrophales bacterium]